MSEIKAVFNVQEVTTLGNGGGTEVKMSPTIEHYDENKELFGDGEPNGFLYLHLNAESKVKFEAGKYQVTFTKID